MKRKRRKLSSNFAAFFLALKILSLSVWDFVRFGRAGFVVRANFRGFLSTLRYICKVERCRAAGKRDRKREKCGIQFIFIQKG